MFTELNLIVERLVVLVLAIVLDLTLGEPPLKLHPTVWMGKVISLLEGRFKIGNPIIEKLYGILMALITITIFTALVYFALILIKYYLGYPLYIIVSAIILKTTFAIKCMEQHIHPIVESIRAEDIFQARKQVSLIVSRDTSKLTKHQVISAAIESIAENIVDGVTSPLFYYAFLGVPGAVAFRAINTLDSMVGYKDRRHINIGWFSAKLDTIANYIPARLTALVMVISAQFVKENSRRAWEIMLRDHDKPDSLNSGWPMAAMAGALEVKLEKPNYYTLGDPISTLSPSHMLRALRLMKLTVIFFIVLIVVPVTITYYLYIQSIHFHISI